MRYKQLYERSVNTPNFYGRFQVFEWAFINIVFYEIKMVKLFTFVRENALMKINNTKNLQFWLQLFQAFYNTVCFYEIV